MLSICLDLSINMGVSIYRCGPIYLSLLDWKAASMFECLKWLKEWMAEWVNIMRRLGRQKIGGGLTDRIHSYKRTQTHSNTHTYTHTYEQTHTHIHIQTNLLKHCHTDQETYKNTNTRKQTFLHRHILTNTHTYFVLQILQTLIYKKMFINTTHICTTWKHKLNHIFNTNSHIFKPNKPIHTFSSTTT